MVGRNLVEKKVETPMIHTHKMVRDFSLGEIISEVTGKEWDFSDKETSEDEGNGIHVYLGEEFFD